MLMDNFFNINIINLSFSMKMFNYFNMKFDLHIHTTLSKCSSLSLTGILDHAIEKGLDGVCITDHHTMVVEKHMTEGLQQNGLCVIIGMEYATCDGDFLIFGPFENLPAGMDAKTLLNIVNHENGAAIAAHPFRQGRPVKEYIIKNNLCHAVETINGRNTDIENLRTDAWIKKYSLKQTGGSDAHTLDELGTVVTCFDRPITSRMDFIHAIKNSTYYPESGMQKIKKSTAY